MSEDIIFNKKTNESAKRGRRPDTNKDATLPRHAGISRLIGKSSESGIDDQGDTTSVKEVKKGRKPSWRPASRLGFLDTPDGFRARWCNSDEANIQKKMTEGWVPVNKTTFPGAAHLRTGAAKEVAEGQNLGSAVRYREMVGMMLPKDIYEARTEYFKNETVNNTRARMVTDAKDKLGDAVAIKIN
jgi:hypothetical protein